MKLKVLSSKQTITLENGKKKEFYRYFTPVEIQVISADGKDLGIQKRNLSVKFTKDAMKKLSDDKVFSIFECKGEDVSHPYVYQEPKDITNKDETSKNDVWVRGWIKETPIPYSAPQNTCSFMVDEEDTESVEITE